jgi:hypothetical protein
MRRKFPRRVCECICRRRKSCRGGITAHCEKQVSASCGFQRSVQPYVQQDPLRGPYPAARYPRDYCMLTRHISRVSFVGTIDPGQLRRGAIKVVSGPYRALGRLRIARARHRLPRQLCSLRRRIAV